LETFNEEINNNNIFIYFIPFSMEVKPVYENKIIFKNLRQLLKKVGYYFRDD